MEQTNRHPADRLADIREQIRQLESEEAKLRAYLLHHPDDLCGHDFEAIVASQTRKRLDLAGLARHVGDAVVERFTVRRSRPVANEGRRVRCSIAPALLAAKPRRLASGALASGAGQAKPCCGLPFPSMI
jgi:hypothetical protein